MDTDSNGTQATNAGVADSSGKFTIAVDASQLIDGYVAVTAVEIPDDAGNEGLAAQMDAPGVFKNTQDIPKPERSITVTIEGAKVPGNSRLTLRAANKYGDVAEASMHILKQVNFYSDCYYIYLADQMSWWRWIEPEDDAKL